MALNVNTLPGKVNITSDLLVGSSHFFVDTINNRVGIRTADPAHDLDVQSTSDAADVQLVRLYTPPNASGVSSTGLKLEKGSGYGGIVKGFLSQGVGSGLSLHTINAGTDLQVMTLVHSGNVGIGAVTDPDSKLEVRGNIKASFSDTNHGMIIDAGGTIRRDFGGNGAGFHFTTNAIWPTNYAGSYNAGGIDFGSSTYRWNNVYTEALNASGTVTATTFTGSLGQSVTPGSYLTGSAYNGSTARTFAVDATTTATASKIVARSSDGYIFSNYINTTDNTVTSGVISLMCKQSDNYHRSASQAAVRSFLGLGAYAYKGESNYNIHDEWLREREDNSFVKLYGNTRAMVFRTDGNTQYASNGGYPFVWLYGGDATSNRVMLINTSGQLWLSNYGWLHDKFAYKAGSTTQAFSASTFTGSLAQSVTPGSYLTGSAYNGSTARTFAVDATTAATVSKIVARDSNGDIFGRYIHGLYINISHGASARNSDTVFYSSTDNYIRKTTAAGMRSSLGLTNSATTTATDADTASTVVMRNSSGDINVRLCRSDYQNQTDCGAAIAFRNSTSDNYIRFCSNMGNVRSRIGCAALAGSTSQNFSSQECYVQNWVRTNGNSGHYWEPSSNGAGWHIYPKDRGDMFFRSGSGNGSICGTVVDTTPRGYVHWTTSNEIGFLTAGRGWSLRMDNSYNCQVYGRMYASGGVNSTMTARYYNSSGGNATHTASRFIGVYASYMIRCSELQVESDRRIKTDIVDVDDSSALELLRKIKPKTYGYVDKAANGEGHVYGFIAQEIKELIPDAVDVSEGDLPNIYKHATIDIQANSITIKDFDTSTLNQTDSIIYNDADDQRKTLKIKSIINSTQVEIEEDLEKLVETFKTSKMKEFNFRGEIFIWGQRVDDFHHLKKSTIFTVATAALQEVDRQLQAEKNENEITRLKLANAESRIATLEDLVTTLLTRVQKLEQR